MLNHNYMSQTQYISGSIVHNTKKVILGNYNMNFVCTCTCTLNDKSYKIKYTSKINIESG